MAGDIEQTRLSMLQLDDPDSYLHQDLYAIWPATIDAIAIACNIDIHATLLILDVSDFITYSFVYVIV